MFTTLAPNIYLFPRDPDLNKAQPNIGLVVSGDESVLIDAGNSPRHARHILLAMDEINAPLVSYVVYTHSHWEHVFGGQSFRVPAIGHELCRKHMLDMAAKPWSSSYLQEEAVRNPQRDSQYRAMLGAVDDWRHFRIVPPQITMSKLFRLHLKDLTIEIEHVGGNHSSDSVVVRIPEAGVMFVGDCYRPPQYQSRRSAESAVDATMIESLLDPRIGLYIDAYGVPRSHDEFARLGLDGRHGWDNSPYGA